MMVLEIKSIKSQINRQWGGYFGCFRLYIW